MEWIALIRESWPQTFAWVVGLAVVFGVLVRLMPCNPGMFWWKDLRAVATDFFYWFVVPIFLGIARTRLLIPVVLLFFAGQYPEVAAIRNLPLWVQCLAILLIQDVLLYWIHRLFHTRLAWAFHAIHHSPQVLDWTATSRFHPVNFLLDFTLADIAVLLMGFAPEALVLLAPFNIIYSAMVHANLNWTFGPLRYVLASPVFHRWHHTTLDEGLNKNFASTFPFLDLLFGTFYMPPGKRPEQFGSGEPDFPQGFWGQLVYPFRVRNPEQPVGWAPVSVGIVLVAGTVLGGLYLANRPAGPNEQPAAESVEVQGRIPANQAGPVVRAPAIFSVAFSGDGQVIVSGSEDGLVKVWDADTLKEKFVLKGHTRPVRSVAISADGEWIVSGSYDQTVKVWNARTGQEKGTLSGHRGFVLSVAIRADGRQIVSASTDGTIKLWDAVSGSLQTTLSHDTGAIPGVALSGDGRYLVSTSWTAARLWEVPLEQELATFTGHANLVYGVAITPDGKEVVTGGFDNTVRLWDARDGKEKLTLTGHTGPVYSVAIHPDSGCIVSGSKDATVKVWDVQTGRERLTLTGHRDSVTSVAISADGQRLVSGSQDGTLKVWDLPSSSLERKQTAGR
jgi:sterol desaturase/sphingolipid hydroxylase (fatty acid hydroxylase superfamily)